MSERLLTAIRDEEAEPVVVERDDNVVRLVLDDGQTLEFDAVEFDKATERAA